MTANAPPFKEGDTIKSKVTDACYVAGALLWDGRWCVDLGDKLGWCLADDFSKIDESFMVTVPREPTTEMFAAATKAGDDRFSFYEMWEAAIAAWEGSQKKD